MVEINKIQNILKNFVFDGELKNVKPISSGHINTTFRAEVCDKLGKINKYTVQKINKYVFKNPEFVMENIVNVTNHLRQKVAEAGGDVDREVLFVVHSFDNKPFFIDEHGEYWRVYKFIDNAHTYDFVDNPKQLYNAGVGFGRFQSMMADFSMDKLHDTIPNFHNTKMRFDQLMEAVKNDLQNRAIGVKKEIEFFEKREDELCLLVNMEQNGKLPPRVTHNDTKFNNILIDDKTNAALSVIDLDTVMPGLTVCDFGDAIRYAANTAVEDEVDLSKVHLDMDSFKYFTEGFLTALNGKLTNTEIEHMPNGAKIITMELSMRFLADHINGDVYFKVHRDGHNLDRARCQMKLAESMEHNFDKMAKLVNQYLI